MTRIIKAKDIKPGMEVEWTQAGVTRKCVAETVDSASPRYGVNLHTYEGGAVYIPRDVEVTVLSEPAPAQPEEPTEFGAKVTVGGEKFLRAQHPTSVPVPWLSESDGKWRNWAAILAMGPVTVIPDQGWTVPDTPEVPERIEEWPDDDTALRKHKWRDLDGRVWSYADGGWQPGNGWAIFGRPEFGPWTRVADA